MTKALPIVTFMLGAGLASLGFLLFAPDVEDVQPASAEDGERIIARVGDRLIGEDAFVEQFTLRSQNAAVDPKALLDRMIEREALIAQAQALGLHEEDAFIEIFEKTLIGRYRERILEQELASATPSEEAVRAEYERRLADYTVPERRKLALIQLPLPAGTPTADIARIEREAADIRELALQQESDVRGFGALAFQFSGDRLSRGRGGDIGWQTEGLDAYRWDHAAITAGFALNAPGAISGIVDGTDGLYLVKLMDIRPREVTPFAQVRDAIRRSLVARLHADIRDTFAESALAKTPVEIDPEAFAIVVENLPKRERDPLKPPSFP